MADRQYEEDQAIGLRRQMGQVEEEPVEVGENTSLPPRSKHHQKRKKKQGFKLKLSFPLIRLLLMLFFILIVIALSSPYWLTK